jgi:phage gp36-like protein
MPVWDFDRWVSNVDDKWTNVEGTGVTVQTVNWHKEIIGFEGPIDTAGFWLNDPQTSVDGLIFEIDFKVEEGSTNVISLFTIGGNTGLNNTDSVGVMFNTFVTPEIRFNDYGQNEVASGTGVASLVIGVTYTAKIKVNANGTATAYVSSSDGLLDNHDLGTTAIATDLFGVPIYAQTNQTYIDPNTNATVWDEFFIHDNGINYDTGDFMSYALNSDVKAEFKSLTYQSDTDLGITSGEVDTWLDQDSATIDSYINNRYSVPVSGGAQSLKVLKKICLLLTVARVRVKIKDTPENRESSKADREQAYQMLNDIRNGVLTLTDADLANAPVARSYNQLNSIEPIHEKETDQW